MINALKFTSTPYMQFSRKQWAMLRGSLSLTLSKEEITKLQGINEELSIEEIKEIYLPLSRLLNFYINFNLRRQTALTQFLGSEIHRTPYIIGIAGSVAVGKSTTARVLQALLSRWPEYRIVELVTTDGFLYSNKILEKRELMNRKGFPESYDIRNLISFISKIKSGEQQVSAPIYSHLLYDIVSDAKKIISKPDILILEGLNVLQNYSDYNQNSHHVFVSDFIDFSIYVDAPEVLLRNWYINRFLKFRQGSFAHPDSYFHSYSKLSEQEAVIIASQLWSKINKRNLQENILPTRERANLILSKSINHAVDNIRLRK